MFRAVIRMKALAIVFLGLFPMANFAQNQSDQVEITWGEESTGSRRSTLSEIVGHDESGFYALYVEAKGSAYTGFKSAYSLGHFDNDVQPINTVALDIGKGRSARTFEDVLQVGESLYLFTSMEDKKSRMNRLYIQEIDKKTLLPDDAREITSIDYSEFNRNRIGGFDFAYSPDSTKMLIYSNFPFKNRANESYGFTVCDAAFNVLWSKEVEIPYEDGLFEVEDYVIDNTGNVYLTGAEYNEKRKSKRKGLPNYRYRVLSYREEGEQFQNQVVDLPGKFITDLQITPEDDGNLLCGGFYSSAGTLSIDGTFFLRLDGESLMVLNESNSEFGIDFITQNMSEREEEKARRKADGKDAELYEYDLRQFVLRSDGGAVLIGEQYYTRTVTRTYTSGNGSSRTTTTTYYKYGDIIVISIDPDGEIAWSQKIAKRQSTSNDGGFYSSYALMIDGDEMHFLFNDNPKNLFLEPGEKVLSSSPYLKESLVVLYTLSWNGEGSKEALFSAKEAEVIVRPKACRQITPNAMVIFGQKKKTQRLARVDFID